MHLQQAVKEWAGVVNALGAGEQLIIVRRYEPRVRDLMLYPTFNYYNSGRSDRAAFDEKFQAPHREKAWTAGEHAMERGQKECLVDVSYWEHVDEVVSIADHSLWKKLSSSYVWSVPHVDSYARGSKTGNVYMWLLRVYKFPKTVVFGRIAQGGPPDFYKHHEEIDTAGSKPVVSDADYDKARSEILKIVQGQKILVAESAK